MMTRYFDKLCLFLSKGSKFDLWHGSLALHDSKVCQTRVQNTHRKLKLGKFYTHVILNRNPLHFVPLSRRNPNLDLWHGNLAPSPSKFRQKKYKIQKENKTLQRKFNTLVVLSVNTLRQVSSWPPKHSRSTAQKCPPPPRWTRVCLLALPPKFFFFLFRGRIENRAVCNLPTRAKESLLELSSRPWKLQRSRDGDNTIFW